MSHPGGRPPIAYGEDCPYCGKPDDTHDPAECEEPPEPDEDKLIEWKRSLERRLNR